MHVSKSRYKEFVLNKNILQIKIMHLCFTFIFEVDLWTVPRPSAFWAIHNRLWEKIYTTTLIQLYVKNERQY